MSEYIKEMVIDPEFVIIEDQKFIKWPKSKDLSKRFQKWGSRVLPCSADYANLEAGVIAESLSVINPWDNSRIASINILADNDDGLYPPFSKFENLNDKISISPLYIGADRVPFDTNMSESDFDIVMNKPGVLNRRFEFTATREYKRNIIVVIHIKEYVARTDKIVPRSPVLETDHRTREPASGVHTFRPDALYLQNIAQQKVLVLSEEGVCFYQRSGLRKSDLKLAWNRINSRKHEKGIVFDTVHLVGPSGTEEIKLEGLSKSKAIELIRIIDSRMA